MLSDAFFNNFKNEFPGNIELAKLIMAKSNIVGQRWLISKYINCICKFFHSFLIFPLLNNKPYEYWMYALYNKQPDITIESESSSGTPSIRVRVDTTSSCSYLINACSFRTYDFKRENKQVFHAFCAYSGSFIVRHTCIASLYLPSFCRAWA